MRAAWLSSILVSGILLSLGVAEAQTAKPQPAKLEARKLADEGQTLFEAGDYRGAIARLREADAKFPAPTIKLALAEAQEKLGQLLEARAVYQRIATADLDKGAPAEFLDA